MKEAVNTRLETSALKNLVNVSKPGILNVFADRKSLNGKISYFYAT